MCGICGELRFADAPPVQADHVRAMRDRLVHRGPDSEGLYVSPDGRAGLGFRRLRIIDLSPNANQPMPNEDGSVVIVFNGEIYNFSGIRRELEARGHRFRSRSDSEVIVHLYEEKGPECFRDLDGMFAVAIWDTRRRQLTLVRDRAGKKPLFYYQDGTRLVFASEVKAFFAHPELGLDIDPESIPYYFLHGYVPTPGSFYRRVKQVEPGTYVTVAADGSTRREIYWQLEYPTAAEVRRQPVNRAAAAATVRDLMTESVRARLMSDVPLGAFLSGGVDSTIVVGLMSRLMAEPVRTFSIGFEGDPAYDETSYARLVAQRFGTNHTEFRVKPNAIDLIEKLVWHYDGPFGDSSAVPTYIVSELTRRQVTVVLTGDGGDELFAGYSRFYAGVIAERIPKSLGRSLNALVSRLGAPSSARHPLARAQRFTRAMTLPLYERMTRWSGLFYEDLEALLLPDLLRTIPPIDRLRYIRGELDAMARRTPLARLLHANYKSYLADDLLVKMDRCSMANSLEARSPFLDRRLTEFVASLPDRFKLARGRTKVILREAFEDLLPPEIDRRGKMGFGVPFGTWFRGELREYLEDLLLAPGARYGDYLSRPYVESLVQCHLTEEADLGLQLWSLLTFEVWLRAVPVWRHSV